MTARFTILCLSSFILFTFYYAYDIPTALNTHTFATKSTLNATHLTLLYSAYAFPNIIIPFFIIKVIPDPVKLCLLALVGNLLFLGGVIFERFSLMLIGRILFGIGGEGFSVMQSKMIAKHFLGKELALSMGISAAIAKCGTVINFIVTPIIAEKFGGHLSCTFGITLILIGILACVKLRQMTVENIEVKLAKNDDVKTQKPFLVITKETMEDGWANFTDQIPEDHERTHDFYEIIGEENQKADYRITNDFLEKNKSKDEVKDETKDKEKEEIDTENNNKTFYPFKKKSQVFSIIVALAFMYAIIFAPFTSISSLLLKKRYSITNTEAGFYMALDETISLFLSIVISIIVDFFGFKLLFISIGTFGLALSFTLLLKNINILCFITCIGISGAFISCHWPCITYFCEIKDIGKAFAICTCVINFAYFFGPLIVSFLFTYDKDFELVCLFLLSVSLLSCVFVCLLSIINRKMALRLNGASVCVK